MQTIFCKIYIIILHILFYSIKCVITIVKILLHAYNVIIVNNNINLDLSTIRLKTGLQVMFFWDTAILAIVILGTVLRINEGYIYYNFIYIVFQSVYQFILSCNIIIYFLNL